MTAARIDDYDWGHMEWLADHESDPGIGLTLARMVIKPGAVSPLHRHDNCAEVLHVLSGAVRLTVRGMEIDLAAGETHAVTSYTDHSLANTGDGDAVLILAFSSGTRHYRPVG